MTADSEMLLCRFLAELEPVYLERARAGNILEVERIRQYHRAYAEWRKHIDPSTLDSETRPVLEQCDKLAIELHASVKSLRRASLVNKFSLACNFDNRYDAVVERFEQLVDGVRELIWVMTSPSPLVLEYDARATV